MNTIKKILKWAVMIVTVFIWVIFIGGADSILEQKLMFTAITAVAFSSFLCYLTWRKEFKEE